MRRSDQHYFRAFAVNFERSQKLLIRYVCLEADASTCWGCCVRIPQGSFGLFREDHTASGKLYSAHVGA
jgi:hypothetical protein